ncbi:hypothetical protein mru_0716 [Methanobrevibacter ruminantium M1]|uniref:Uncharacterized protein n=1 Tax=Methanobrevibacter ruminantium (strain ATCC 35063 / DSM 1093 / JCM 13430 / OCM 146 / M1) TaxID=634498 RepID=D3E206_METRM|nr:hypothetical protein [Methanobrevibacter ruminantium]ADC46567.1 hypothetical protein mru_0716 [Methanobrevibacter ruminantium M1]
MNLKINKYIPFGIILIILGGSLYFLSGIDQFIRPFTQPILMGSSKGKDILFFVLFGITIILSSIGDNERIHNYLMNLSIPEKLKDKDFYLKLSLILFLITAISGLAVELYLRASLGLNWNTILVIMNPSLTSTSFLHSHLYKSIFGIILGIFLSHIPAGIHTGSSLSSYAPSVISLLFILIPITYISMVLSNQRRKAASRILLAFTSTLGIIGLIDGGLFATPAIGGIYGILILMYNEEILDGISDFITEKDKRDGIKEKLNEELRAIKSIFNNKNIKKYLKIALPHIALILIIILRFSVAFYGACPDSYELIISNGHDLDLDEYDTLNISENGDRTVVHLSNQYNEMELFK